MRGGRAAVTGWDQGDLVTEPGEGLLMVLDEVLVIALVALVVVVRAGFGVVAAAAIYGSGSGQEAGCMDMAYPIPRL